MAAQYEAVGHGVVCAAFTQSNNVMGFEQSGVADLAAVAIGVYPLASTAGVLEG
ncbi:MAG: hypothetical protein J2O48_02510 [Solirubrobacterales bacterium]|nr:hypothetical protein [Solirubrobacterales bacterium]